MLITQILSQRQSIAEVMDGRIDKANMSTPSRGTPHPSPRDLNTRSPVFPPNSRGHLTPKAIKQPSSQESRGKWKAAAHVEIQSNPETPRKGSESIADLKKELADLRIENGKQLEALKLAGKQIQEKDQVINDLQSTKSALESELSRLRLQFSSPLSPNPVENTAEEEIKRLKAELEEMKGKVMTKADHLFSLLQPTCSRLNSSELGDLSVPLSAIYETACLARFELEGLQYLLKHMRQGEKFMLEVLESRRMMQKQWAGVGELKEEMRAVERLVGEVKEELTSVYFENCRILWHN